MKDYTSPRYYEYRNTIKKRRDRNMSWEELEFAGRGSIEGLEMFLEMFADANDTELITTEDWKELVKRAKLAEEEALSAQYVDSNSMIVDEGQDNAVCVPPDEDSSWQMYRAHLLKQGFKEAVVDEIEKSTLRTLKRLSSDTTEQQPIKGLVIGNVQSGKTSNMEALMAMAADWGWNMFIILSGTIENLRHQTQSRMLNDLVQAGGVLSWKGLEKLSKNCKSVDKAQYLQFNEGSHNRYFTVCLKNSTRLSNLIQWLNDDQNTKRQMKILLIDDEADQAGINTKKIVSSSEEQERNRINELIINLVSGLDEKGKKTKEPFKAMNYIGYTATPYASILNEARLESLYPRNFISTLSVSKEYFGPQQIFGADGVDYDGMDIIRIIPEQELQEFSNVHSGDFASIPKSLEDALCWYLCGAASMRLWKYKKPVSMLIHTSQKQVHHRYVYEAVKNWLSKNPYEIIFEKCKNVWEEEIERFSFEDFRAQYFDYNAADEEINKYPDFDEIVPVIKELLSEITNIPLGDEGDLRYHKGLHICVDNCSNNGLNEDGMYMRLAYPDSKDAPCHAPAFIVVGGATLSRGLTIEGVISTLFLRSVGQADTLMQMGRWFGYRKGYELLPRIWLTEKTQSQFVFLATLDQELRDEISFMDKAGMSPSEYGPRIKNTPMYKFIRITAANRMQSAQTAVVDFSGSKNQTIIFDNNKAKLEKNIIATEKFIEELNEPDTDYINRYAKNCFVWRQVQLERVLAYLRAMHFSKRMRVFNDIESIADWLKQLTEKGDLNSWNIVVAGNATGEEWVTPVGVTHKVTRTRRKNRNGSLASDIIDIGALRTPTDLIADIDESEMEEADLTMLDNFKSSNVGLIREKANVGRTPQLIIYRIDKNSKKANNNENREDLKASEDIIGVCMNIPGAKRGSNYAASVQIRLEDVMDDDNGDLQENE